MKPDAAKPLSPFRITIAPMILGLVAGLVCYLSSGASLGFYLGSLTLSAVIAPAMIAGQRNGVRALLAAGGVIDALGVVWLISIFESDVSFIQWLECYLVLAGFVLGICGLAWLCRWIVGSIFAAAATTVIALAWLLWPVWLPGHLSGPRGATIVSWLTPAHPLLAINHVLIDQGIWTQQRLMYQHTALGQDIAYMLPRSIWPSVVTHAAIGLALLWAGGSAGRKRNFPPQADSLPMPTDA